MDISPGDTVVFFGSGGNWFGKCARVDGRFVFCDLWISDEMNRHITRSGFALEFCRKANLHLEVEGDPPVGDPAC